MFLGNSNTLLECLSLSAYASVILPLSTIETQTYKWLIRLRLSFMFKFTSYASSIATHATLKFEFRSTISTAKTIGYATHAILKFEF